MQHRLKPGQPRRQFIAATLCAAAAPALWAQPAGRHRAVYMYSAADREDKLVAAARKEGSVQLYTSMNKSDVQALTDAFTARFKVRADVWRASSEEVLKHTMNEARANLHKCDVIETNGPEIEMLYRQKVLDEFHSAHIRDIPPAAVPKHGHYIADRFNFFTLGYNTSAVPPLEAPNTLMELLQPKFAGKIGLESSDADWFAAVVKGMGEQKGMDFFRRLAAMKPRMVDGHTLLATMLSTGHVGLTPTIYNHSVEKMKAMGAPVRWKAIDPTYGRPNCIAPARNAPHPNAAMLFIDFMLSPEGQRVLAKRFRVPSSLAVDTSLNKFTFQTIDPVISLEESAKWEKAWSQLFLGGQKIKKEAE
jgi:iron(III) transport system substrate-binding protein